MGFESVRLGLCECVYGVEFDLVELFLLSLRGGSSRGISRFVMEVDSALSVVVICGSGTGGGAFVCGVPDGSAMSTIIFGFSVIAEAAPSMFMVLSSLAGGLPAVSPIAPGWTAFFTALSCR